LVPDNTTQRGNASRGIHNIAPQIEGSTPRREVGGGRQKPYHGDWGLGDTRQTGGIPQTPTVGVGNKRGRIPRGEDTPTIQRAAKPIWVWAQGETPHLPNVGHEDNTAPPGGRAFGALPRVTLNKTARKGGCLREEKYPPPDNCRKSGGRTQMRIIPPGQPERERSTLPRGESPAETRARRSHFPPRERKETPREAGRAKAAGANYTGQQQRSQQ